jgi:hypothetical protein
MDAVASTRRGAASMCVVVSTLRGASGCGGMAMGTGDTILLLVGDVRAEAGGGCGLATEVRMLVNCTSTLW